MPYNSFEEMPVWQKAMDMAVEIFFLTEGLPRREDCSLTSQIRRSSLSVPGNISEGFGRKHTKEKLNFYYDARGSLAETKSHLIYDTVSVILKRQNSTGSPVILMMYGSN